MSYTDPTGGWEIEDPWEGGGGGCDPFFDPFCGLLITDFLYAGGGWSLEYTRFPWPELPPGLFGDLGDSGQSSPPKTKWGDCWKRVFLPCMNQAEASNQECRNIRGGLCALQLAACGPFCTPYDVELCIPCLDKAVVSCAAGFESCRRRLETDTSVCFAKLNACAAVP